MAAFNSALFIGAREVRPTDAQILIIEQFEAGLGDAGVARLWRHLHYFVQHVAIAATINGGTVTSLNAASRVPYKLVGVDLGCEAAASTAVANIEKEPAAGGGYATMMEATVDIAGAVGAYIGTGEVTDGQEDVEIGDKVRLTVTAGAGDCTGAQALLHCIRR